MGAHNQNSPGKKVEELRRDQAFSLKCKGRYGTRPRPHLIIEGLRSKTAFKRPPYINGNGPFKDHGKDYEYTFKFQYFFRPRGSSLKCLFHAPVEDGLFCVLLLFFMEYPCGICGSEVRDGQKAIFCDVVCLLWYHAQCVDMTIEE